MSFMQRQIIKGDWYKCETTAGTEFIEADLVSPNEEADLSLLGRYTEGEVTDMEVLRGWYGARLSAPGYMDRTDWACFKTEKEAQDYLDEMYPEEND